MIALFLEPKKVFSSIQFIILSISWTFKIFGSFFAILGVDKAKVGLLFAIFSEERNRWKVFIAEKYLEIVAEEKPSELKNLKYSETIFCEISLNDFIFFYLNKPNIFPNHFDML